MRHLARAPSGRGYSIAKYKVLFNIDHIYKERYFDTDDFRLYRGGQTLRYRRRWDRAPGKKNFKFKKALFQSKGKNQASPDLNRAFMARDEIPGEVFSQGLKKSKFGACCKPIRKTSPSVLRVSH